MHLRRGCVCIGINRSCDKHTFNIVAVAAIQTNHSSSSRGGEEKWGGLGRSFLYVLFSSGMRVEECFAVHVGKEG